MSDLSHKTSIDEEIALGNQGSKAGGVESDALAALFYLLTVASKLGGLVRGEAVKVRRAGAAGLAVGKG
jgi:hypothetical protein